jgi:hypothetical protein
MSDGKPYVSLDELAKLIPFSTQAIRMYVHRESLREGIHFFRKGRRIVFKWAAVCDWLEGRSPSQSSGDTDTPAAADIVPVRRRA